MPGDRLLISIALFLYMAIVIAIGIYYAKRANASSENYLIGGRSLGPFVTAVSAESLDMRIWFLILLSGISLNDFKWITIGIFAGIYLNWRFVAPRLRKYSAACNSITIPDFISSRFKEKKKVLLTIAALFILIFFTVYIASCFLAVGKFFSGLFAINYPYMMIAGALFVLCYTLIGGFLAESVSDLVHGVVIALLLLLVLGVVLFSMFMSGGTPPPGGGVSVLAEKAKSIPGFFEFLGITQPTLVSGIRPIDEAGKVGLLAIISALSFGLGYFGMPQVLVKFMAIKKCCNFTSCRKIAMICCGISLAVAFIIVALFSAGALLPQSVSENILKSMSANFIPSLFLALIMVTMLSSITSSSDSFLLIAASAFSKNIYHGVMKKEASDKRVLLVSRIALLVIAVLAMIIALNRKNVVLDLLSFAWAGFGATFGPVILFSLFWKRITRNAAIAGMLTGGGMVCVWKLLLKPLGGIFGIYELLPAFVISCVVIVVVSLMGKKPTKDVLDEFESVDGYEC